MAFTNQVSNYGSYKYVVSSTAPGPYNTIQAAINEVVAQGDTTTIFVRPGSYTENLTLYTGVDIQGSEEGQVTITGVHVPPAAGTFAISNCKLVSATHAFSSLVAGTAAISVKNCQFTLTSGYVFNMDSWTGDLSIANCADSSVDNGIITNSLGAALDIVDSSIGAGATGMGVTGVTTIYNSRIFCPISITVNAVVSIDGGSVIDGAISLADPAELNIYNSRVSSGAVACITTVSTGLTTLENVVLDSSALVAIAGTGQIELGSVTFNDTSAIAGTITYDNASLFGASSVNIEHILFLNGSSGSAGQVLTSNGAVAPTWQANSSLGWSAMNADGTLVVNQGRVNTKTPGLLTATLPATAALGDIIVLQGSAVGNGGFLLAQNANQAIQAGATLSTIGVGGSLASSDNNDSISLVCTVAGASTRWNVFSVIGNPTIV